MFKLSKGKEKFANVSSQYSGVAIEQDKIIKSSRNLKEIIINFLV